MEPQRADFKTKLLIAKREKAFVKIQNSNLNRISASRMNNRWDPTVL